MPEDGVKQPLYDEDSHSLPLTPIEENSSFDLDATSYTGPEPPIEDD